MAKINTTDYQPITAWNGTQDLLIVEQPDGTKVATPEQVKQYVEAGDFEATGEIKDGHGNILKTAVQQISGITDLVAFKDITVSDPSSSLTEAQMVKAIIRDAISNMNVSQNYVIANISYSNAYRGQILFSRVAMGVSYGCGIYTSYYADCNVYRFALRNGAVSVVKLADAT